MLGNFIHAAVIPCAFVARGALAGAWHAFLSFRVSYALFLWTVIDWTFTTDVMLRMVAGDIEPAVVYKRAKRE